MLLDSIFFILGIYGFLQVNFPSFSLYEELNFTYLVFILNNALLFYLMEIINSPYMFIIFNISGLFNNIGKRFAETVLSSLLSILLLVMAIFRLNPKIEILNMTKCEYKFFIVQLILLTSLNLYLCRCTNYLLLLLFSIISFLYLGCSSRNLLIDKIFNISFPAIRNNLIKIVFNKKLYEISEKQLESIETLTASLELLIFLFMIVRRKLRTRKYKSKFVIVDTRSLMMKRRLLII